MGDGTAVVGAAERTQDGERDRSERDRFFDVSLDLLSVADLDRAKLIRINPAWERTLGWSGDELLVSGWMHLVHPDDVDATNEVVERLARGNTVSGFEHRLRTKAGGYCWLRWTATPVLDERRIYASAHDITDQRIAAERDRLLFDRSPSPMWLFDEETLAILDVNQATLALYGFTRAELAAMTIRDLIVESEHADMAVHLAAVVERGGTRIVQRRHRTKSGAIRDVEVTAHRLEVGARPAILAVITDVTERKRAEQQLHASEQRYRRIVENTSEGVWTYDASATTTFMNRRMVELLGVRVEEAVGTSIYSFMHEEDLAEARRRVARQLGGISERGEFRLKRRDGSDVWVSLHADPLLDKDGKFEMSLALVTDIGERRRADETRSLLASIVTSSGNAIISRGIDGKIKTWNVGAERLTQYTAEEAIGKPVDMLFPPRLVEKPDPDRDRLDRGEIIEQCETSMIRKDRTLVEVSLSSGVLDNGLGVSIIAHNISERRRAEGELRRTEEQLRQAQKMEAIGSLAGGVAHDFNNILSVILSYAELSAETLAPSDPLRTDLSEISLAALRATALTRQLLAFSRKQILQPTSLDLNDVLRNIQKMLVRMLGEDVELTIAPAQEPMQVHADAGQIEQVIMNLVVNARDAMPSGGHVTMETAAIEVHAKNAEAHLGVRPGTYVMLTTTDTGIGIDPAMQARIFEPFFTTKDKSKGTGLGLSTVFGIVEQSGGHIGVHSELGKGTTFKIYLPRTARDDRSQPLPVFDAMASFHGTETILLVEDEPQVRNVMRMILSKRGYTVLEAENAGDAFLQCEQFQGKIHLLVTDVVMPRMSGRQLADRLELQRPDMSVLFVSGYTDDAIVHHGVLNAGLEFLSKPIMPETLLRKVREVLDTPL